MANHLICKLDWTDDGCEQVVRGREKQSDGMSSRNKTDTHDPDCTAGEVKKPTRFSNDDSTGFSE